MKRFIKYLWLLRILLMFTSNELKPHKAISTVLTGSIDAVLVQLVLEPPVYLLAIEMLVTGVRAPACNSRTTAYPSVGSISTQSVQYATSTTISLTAFTFDFSSDTNCG
jgi:hypothetical protein